MTTNFERRDRAAVALQAYIEARGENYEESLSEIGDLIADLLHLATQGEEKIPAHHETPVDYVLDLGRMHFDAEHNNPEETED